MAAQQTAVGISSSTNQTVTGRNSLTSLINARELTLSDKPLTFDLAAHPETIAAWIDVYVDSVEKLGENPYCNDVGPTRSAAIRLAGCQWNSHSIRFRQRPDRTL